MQTNISVVEENWEYDLCGSVVNLSSCTAFTMGSMTAVELSMNQLLIDVGVGVVSSKRKLILLSPTAGCGSCVTYMRQ